MNDHLEYLVKRKDITYILILADLFDSPIRKFSHIAICLGPMPVHNLLNSFQAFRIFVVESSSPGSMLCRSFLCTVLKYNGPAVRHKLSSRPWIVVWFHTLEVMIRHADCFTSGRSRCSVMGHKAECE
jgi:hypothetical protein